MASFDATKVHIGAGDIFIGGTAPVAGTDPSDPTLGTPTALVTADADFDGVSTTGTGVGSTNGPATFTYRPTFYQVMNEQAFAEIATVPTAEEASLAFGVQELTYQNIHSTLGQTVTRVVGTGVLANVNYGGGLATVPVATAVLLSRKRTGVGYYVVCLYQAYSADGGAANFERRAETRLAVTLRALADGTRPVGDQLFQFVEYPANPV
jgi:hypothetical protein